MSGSLITAVNCSGEKFHNTGKNVPKKLTEAEIQASPILLFTTADTEITNLLHNSIEKGRPKPPTLTGLLPNGRPMMSSALDGLIPCIVEYPQNGKITGNFSKSSVQTIQLSDPVQRADAIPYTLLQLGDSEIKTGASFETYEGSIEVDGTKLNSEFGPVLVIRNEGPVESHCPSTSDSLSKTNTPEQALLNNFLFSPLPKSVVCTVMSKDAREGEAPENPVNYNAAAVEIQEINQTVKSEDTFSDDESVHVISDKPVTCRSLASLPASFLYFGKTSSKRCKGVFARKEIPSKSRFGPMEGILNPHDPNVPMEHLILTIESNGSHERLDVSNENTSNWMRHVRPAESVDEQNLNLHQCGKHLYFSAIRTILPGEELKAWYSSSYAKLRNLALLCYQRKSVKCKGNPSEKDEDAVEKENVSLSIRENGSSKWKCTHCQRIFKSATLFNLHVLTHAADNLEISDNCDKLVTLSSMEPQTVNNKLNEETFACSQCPKTFSSSATLNIHLRTHSSTKAFDCPICQEIFYKVPNFREHIHTHAIGGVFQCPHCYKNFSEYKHIRGHMRRFHCGKNFVCLQCPKKFSTLDKLKAHHLSHSDYREFSCATCGKQFKRKDKLSVHVKKKCGLKRQNSDNLPKKKCENYSKCVYNCHICLIGFKRRGMLVNHLAARHPEISPDSVPELNLPIFKDNKDYYCQYCGKTYKSSTKRKAHIVKIHPGKELPSSSKNSPISSKDDQEWNDSYSQTVGSVTKLPQGCQWCYKQYASKAKLLQHQRKKHPSQLPKSLLHPKKPGGYNMESEERDAVKEAVEKVTESDIFLSDPLEFSEYELSVGDGEFIIDANTLKSAIKGDVLPSDCSPEALAELGQIIEIKPDGYFKVYQSPSGITVAHPVEVWDPLSLCLSPPPSTHLLPSTN